MFSDKELDERSSEGSLRSRSSSRFRPSQRQPPSPETLPKPKPWFEPPELRKFLDDPRSRCLSSRPAPIRTKSASPAGSRYRYKQQTLLNDTSFDMSYEIREIGFQSTKANKI